jgi:hypothetical protein
MLLQRMCKAVLCWWCRRLPAMLRSAAAGGWQGD